MGFISTVGSIVVGGVVAAVTVVGLVSNTVNSTPDNPGETSQQTSIQYGSR